jgi:hypothetical protein
MIKRMSIFNAVTLNILKIEYSKRLALAPQLNKRRYKRYVSLLIVLKFLCDLIICYRVAVELANSQNLAYILYCSFFNNGRSRSKIKEL